MRYLRIGSISCGGVGGLTVIGDQLSQLIQVDDKLPQFKTRLRQPLLGLLL